MIKNDKQFNITKTRLEEFRRMLADVKSNNDATVDLIYKKIEEDALESQILQFEKEIKEYELLKTGKVNYISVDSISNFHEALIKARIIKGWTQAELAAKLDMKEQQIQRYEFTNYDSASISRINEIAEALQIEIRDIRVKVAEPGFTSLTPYETIQLTAAREKMRNQGMLLPI